MTAVIEQYTEKNGDGGFMFECPGCGQTHAVPVGSGSGPRWGFNGSLETPTFTPSILVQGGHFSTGGREGKECWCTFEARFGRPAPFKCVVCHSFVTDGKIQFLGDCTHALAGQTVPLTEVAE